MEWAALLILVVVVGVVLGLKRTGSVSPAAARAYLRQGAKVIDVRSPEEFRARHVAHAINVPLGQLGQQIGRHAPDKNAVLLLHCLSGGRSGLGVRALKRLGYLRVYNLGSLERAERIVQEHDAEHFPPVPS